jgi:ubiquinone/menaquinone biosynthesis C-methylase UbiE
MRDTPEIKTATAIHNCGSDATPPRAWRLLERRNRNAYDRRDVVRFYARRGGLMPSERALLERLRPCIARMRVLDIGVGGGRTAEHIAPLAREYVGVDYLASMVEACRARFAGVPGMDGARFEVCDARRMEAFSDNAFDLVMFPFNGIDGMGHDDRIATLREVARVARPGGVFFFSTHNMQSLHDYFHLRAVADPFELVSRVVRCVRLWLANPPLYWLKNLPLALVSDGSLAFRGLMYHIRPHAQIQQLESLGFDDVEVWSSADGVPIARDRLADAAERWLSFVCRVGRAA